MWILYIGGGQQAVRSAFGSEDVPEFESLVLEQVVLNNPDELALTLRLCHMPRSIPLRWKETGCDQLQLRLLFVGTDDLVIRQDPTTSQCGPRWNVSIVLEENSLRIASADGSFELTSSFVDSHLEFYPYRSGEFELGRSPAWFRQF